MYLEAPIELRYSSNPLDAGNTIKVALGVKVGTIIKAYTKGKNLVDKNGNSLNNYIEKEYNKRFFNSTRLAFTARFGYGSSFHTGRVKPSSAKVKPGRSASAQPSAPPGKLCPKKATGTCHPLQAA